MPWWDGAIQRPAPVNKTGGYSWGNHRDGIGAVVHSAAGSLAGAFSRLDGAASVSWHFTVAQDGQVHQHYEDITLACWHAREVANRRHVGIECEGGPPGNEGEPFTQA